MSVANCRCVVVPVIIDPERIDAAARWIGSVPDVLLVLAEIPEGHCTREGAIYRGKGPEELIWAWCISALHNSTDARGAALILACRMFAEDEVKNEVAIAT